MKKWLKRIISALSTKTNELRVRIMIFLLLHKHTHTIISHSKLHSLVAPKKNDDVLKQQDDDDVTHGGMPASGTHMLTSSYPQGITATTTDDVIMQEGDVEDDVYSDLTHDLFRESEAAMEAEEEDVDEAADVFIRWFKQRIQSPEIRMLQSN